MNRTTLALAVAIPALCMGAVNAQTTNIPLPPALLACAEETDVLRRLACFDREVARLRDVPESVPEPTPGPTVAAPGAQADPGKVTAGPAPDLPAQALSTRAESDVGSAPVATIPSAAAMTASSSTVVVTSPQSNIESPPAADDVGTRDQYPDEFSATVNDIAHRPYGEMIILLDNGQVWEQKHRDTRFRLKIGDSVTISRGLISGYRWRGASRNHSIQVERFK